MDPLLLWSLFPYHVAISNHVSKNIFISRLYPPFAGRWNAPADNGASIQQFILECDEGLGGQPAHFVPVFEGRAKQYNVARLLPSTLYK